MTTQRADKIQYQGQKYPLFSEPLEAYFRMSSMRPNFMSISTADIRGYQAEWQIVDDALFLVELSAYSYDSALQGFQLVFPGVAGPVYASWFTGELRLQDGRIIGSTAENSGYNRLYEQELVLAVEAGVVRSFACVRHERRDEQ